jgi:hypothetical protein
MAESSKRSGGRSTAKRTSSRPSAKRSSSGANGGGERRGRMSAPDAVRAVREQLPALLGRPVEAVLGVEKDGRDWVVKAQVVELERIPNTTDVLGEYEAVIDGGGELVSCARTQRYHRGQVDGER